MRTFLAVALFVVSLPVVAHAEPTDASTDSVDDCCSLAPFADDENQADDEGELIGSDVLFGGTPSYGVYLAPTVETGRIERKAGVLFGARGGLIVSDVLTIGGGMNWLLDGPTAPTEGAPAIRMQHGGGLLGLTVASDQIVHPTIDVLLGGGQVTFDYDRPLMQDERANVFVLDVSTGLDINLTHGIRAHVGGGYRHVSNFELDGLTDEDVGGFFGSFQLKFGTF